MRVFRSAYIWYFAPVIHSCTHPQIAQQLPEYGVLFHRVAREKKLAIGELLLGICAKGIMVYEVKNTCRILIRRFHWTETDSISTSVSAAALKLTSKLYFIQSKISKCINYFA